MIAFELGWPIIWARIVLLGYNKKGTSKFVAGSKKKNWANWADCYMGRMRIATSFATSLALSAATSHVIIHVVLFGSICYDEFVSAFINDRENDVL